MLNQTLALVAIAIVILSSSCANLDSTVATSPSSPAPPSLTQETPSVNAPTANFPEELANRVIKDLSQRTNIPADQLSVYRKSQETWTDGCLGLGKPEELCSAALVEGWQVVVKSKSQSWVYHTDGERVKLNEAASKI
ncbi:MAG: hypothetical protein WA865_00890 [Spirulinaceae cyanobacterium]